MGKFKIKKAPKNPMQLPRTPQHRSRCTKVLANGKRCKGWVGIDGYCAAHRKGSLFQQNKTLLSPTGKPMLYRDYLRTEHWAKKRKEALHYFGYRCCNCGAEDTKLNVHHTHYESLWKEDMIDLRVLCSKCHKKAHRRRCNHD